MHLASPLLLAAFWDAQLTRWVVWVGLVLLTVALLVLIRTRWGQSQPLGKCVVLSLVAHLLLAIYFSTVNIVSSTVGSPDGKGIQVALVDGSIVTESETTDSTQPNRWDTFADPAPGIGVGTTPDLSPPGPAATVPPLAEPDRLTPVEPPPAAPANVPPTLPASEEADPPAIVPAKDVPAPAPAKDAQPIDLPPPVDPPEADPVPPPEPATADDSAKTPSVAGPSTQKPKNDVPPLVPIPSRPGGKGDGQPGSGQNGNGKGMPEEFKLRTGDPTGDHTQVAKGNGATQESEAAVNAALRWLAANQGPNGRWEARRNGGGANRAADGEDRFGAGTTADTGITGLALLAFLAAGNTHLQGQHQTTVRRGLEFLLSMQGADGNLGASQNMYEKMYCHAMATCAISEAYAMSGDDRLKAAVQRAIGFTLASQDRGSGGWRYGPNQSGDTSQLGWQVMSLKSAQLGGIAIPDQTRAGIERFLRSVALGRSSGLACYQPVRPVQSRSMTAEALACRQFLGIVDAPAAQSEASNFILQEVPGAGTTNFYYWYYATLSMYQMQGEPWRKWNEALQKKLLPTQRTDGELAGSWDPDPVWGGCGGRCYSTSLGALSLEVYYRFLPLFVQANDRNRRVK